MTDTDGSRRVAWDAMLEAIPASIPRDARNTHHGYDFVSIDAFVAAVGPVLRKFGFAPVLDEVACEPLDGDKVLFRFRCGLSYLGDAPPWWEHRSIILRGVTPQATGQAASYVLRVWLSKLFGVDVGDAAPDVDADEAQPAKPVKKAAKRPVKKAAKKAVKTARTETQMVNAAKRQVLKWVGGDKDLAASIWETGGGTLAGAKEALNESRAKVTQDTPAKVTQDTPSGTVTYAPGEEPF